MHYISTPMSYWAGKEALHLLMLGWEREAVESLDSPLLDLASIEQAANQLAQLAKEKREANESSGTK